MTAEFALVPSRRTVFRLDVVAVVTVAAFTTLGLAVGLQLWNVAQVHRGLLDVATALESTGQAVGLVAELPLIGPNARPLEGDIARAADEVRVSAGLARDATRAVAVGVGATIALLVWVPVAVLYLPLRLARRRELRGLRRQLAGPVDPMLIEHLARTAVRRVPFGELRRITPRPWHDLERGRHTHLAAAELRRLGVAADPAWSPEPAGTQHRARS